MKKMLLSLFLVVNITGMAGLVFAGKAEEKLGEKLFMANCKVCHPNGGNIVNPAKTLHKKDREANGVKTAADIVKRMRNPGPGMTKFDEQTISDKDAHAIAEYVLKHLQK